MNEIRLRYIREAGNEIRKSEYRKIHRLWENPAHRWNEREKVCVIIPLRKKGDTKDLNNFRGVRLLLIMSRNLASILATRLRNWAKATGALGENQGGFRQAVEPFVKIIVLVLYDEGCTDTWLWRHVYFLIIVYRYLINYHVCTFENMGVVALRSHPNMSMAEPRTPC